MAFVGQVFSLPEPWFRWLYAMAREAPAAVLLLAFHALAALAVLMVYVILHLVAPQPRAPLASEKTYITTNPDGSLSDPRPLPCWLDRWVAERLVRRRRGSATATPTMPDDFSTPAAESIEPAEVAVSVVVPAYNEAARIVPTLEEMVAYLDLRFGRTGPDEKKGAKRQQGVALATRPSKPTMHHRLVFKNGVPPSLTPLTGYEILVVNDDSRDGTVQVALGFARKHELHDILRVITLARNRGKGGAVTHGFRHVRGQHVLFADADGASRFRDLDKLLDGCEDVVDGSNRGVAIGSRAHLVGSDAVVKRSAVRNFLMRSFHLVITILTPPATSRIRDTQCGFKLFSRACLPYIIPYMHTEGWIFDIEMLMLAESAPATPVLASDGSVIGTSSGIRVAEVPIDWHEVGGSKMNLVQDSIHMALGLAVLRASWMMGVYRQRLSVGNWRP